MARIVLGWLILMAPLCGCAVFQNLITRKATDPAEAYKTGRYANWENELNGDPKAVQWGEPLYLRYCKSCHGEKGDGDSEKAPLYETKPANLTGTDLPDGRIMHAMTYGTHETAMLPFGKALTEWERAAIIAYIRTLPESDYGKMPRTTP